MTLRSLVCLRYGRLVVQGVLRLLAFKASKEKIASTGVTGFPLCERASGAADR